MWQQARLFFGDGAMIAAGPTPPMGDCITPAPSLGIAFGQRGEDSARPKRIMYIADCPLHPPFLISSSYLARPGREEILAAQFNQAGMEVDLVAVAPFEHHALESAREYASIITKARQGAPGAAHHHLTEVRPASVCASWHAGADVAPASDGRIPGRDRPTLIGKRRFFCGHTGCSYRSKKNTHQRSGLATRRD